MPAWAAGTTHRTITPSVLCCERRVVSHHALRCCRAESEQHEILGRNIWQHQAGHVLKAKPAVIRRLSKNDTARSTCCSQCLECLVDELRANALLLALRLDGNRTKAIPALSAIRDGDRRYGEMPNDGTLYFCHQRQGERACIAQSGNDAMFVVVRMCCVEEGLLSDSVDGRRVGRYF